MQDAPMKHKGKTLQYIDTYRSPYQQRTPEGAERELDRMRELCPESKGWLELNSYIEQTPQGYRAVRYQAKYD